MVDDDRREQRRPAAQAGMGRQAKEKKQNRKEEKGGQHLFASPCTHTHTSHLPYLGSSHHSTACRACTARAADAMLRCHLLAHACSARRRTARYSRYRAHAVLLVCCLRCNICHAASARPPPAHNARARMRAAAAAATYRSAISERNMWQTSSAEKGEYLIWAKIINGQQATENNIMAITSTA